jgi:hypothetical protein
MGSTTHFRLTENFMVMVNDLMTWYHAAVVGDTAVIPLPARTCRVRLVCGVNQQVGWWPDGGRMVTMSLVDAVWRLRLLYNSKRV